MRHLEKRNTVRYDLEFECDYPRHLNSATEGYLLEDAKYSRTYFSVSLREMKISDGELATLDVNRHVRFATPRQVFDVTIPTFCLAARVPLNYRVREEELSLPLLLQFWPLNRQLLAQDERHAVEGVWQVRSFYHLL